MHTTADNGSLLFESLFQQQTKYVYEIYVNRQSSQLESNKIDLNQRLILLLPHFKTD